MSRIVRVITIELAAALLLGCCSAQPSADPGAMDAPDPRAMARNTVRALVNAAADESSEPEAEVTLAGKVPVLNQATFRGNVHAEEANVEHWFVMYCFEWWRPCQALRPAFYEAAREHERRLNAGALVKLTVRFAEVDCAADKALCNEQAVEGYPQVIHYHRGEVVASWRMDDRRSSKVQAARMARFFVKQTDFPAGRSAYEAWSDSFVGSRRSTARRHPARIACRLVPFAAAFVSMGIWTATHGLELLQQLRPTDRPLADGDSEKPGQPPESWMPGSWTRGSIEL